MRSSTFSLAFAALLPMAGCGEGCGGDADPTGSEPSRVAVETAPITSGTLRDKRTFTGTLEASAEARVVAKVTGLIESVDVDIGDTLEQGQVVAIIDDAVEVQSNAQARGDLAVERASLDRAKSALALAETEAERAKELHRKGLVSEQRVEQAAAAVRSAKAALALSRGSVQRATASVELTRIRRGYAEVRVSWDGPSPTATVARRHQDAGNTVQPGDPLVDAVVLDPIIAVTSVPERDYGRLTVGQTATLTTDTVPDETFTGKIARIAPVFERTSRQASVELEIDNPDHRLKPGAFAEIQLVLGTTEAEAIVPRAAITRRREREVIFLLGPSNESVVLRPVEVGIREGERVAISPADGQALSGDVVILGQHLLGDGSAVRVIDPEPATDRSAPVSSASNRGPDVE